MTSLEAHSTCIWTTQLDGLEAAVRVKRMAVSVSVGKDTVYTFDLEGRLYGCFINGANYRRGLDNEILEKRRVDGRRLTRKLVPHERNVFLDRTHRLVARLAQAVGSGDESVRHALRRMIRWTPDRCAADGRRFHEVYLPVTILPPDQYMALVVQATEGCPWNRCTFCDLYRDRRFRIRTGDDLRRHIEGVKAFVGDGLRLRRSIFLGDANALTMPWKQLEETFSVLRHAFPPRAVNGPTVDDVHAFTDAFAPGLRTESEIRRLSEWGLRRVTIGLETGHDPLLSWVEKQGTSNDAVEAVRHLKVGGVHVNVVVMAGLGGERYADAHVEDTVKVVEKMELGRGDIIYLSPLVVHAHLPYAPMAAAAGVKPHSPAGIEEQLEAMRSELTRRSGPTVARYDMGRFVY